MDSDRDNDGQRYTVVVNAVGQYSVWPAVGLVPRGWKSHQVTGSKEECLRFIESVWRDLRPQCLEEFGKEAATGVEPADADDVRQPEISRADRGLPLVQRLALGRHPVETALQPENTIANLRERLDRGSIPIRFTQTRGGTELLIRLDQSSGVAQSQDFGARAGTIHLEGSMILNGRRVRCVVDLDSATLRGDGQLVPIDSVDA